MSGIGIITNPHSKLNKRKPETPKLLGYILGEHGRLEVTQSLEDLSRVAHKFRDANVEILALNGGDGTISRTLTAIIEAYGDKPLPKFALLRGGTMNVLASNLGIRGGSAALLYRLCEGYSSEKVFRTEIVSSLNVNNSYGFLFADGVAWNLLDEFYKNKTGPLGVVWLVLRLAFSIIVNGKLCQRLMKNQAVSLTCNGKETVGHDSCMVAAASIERLPFGFRLFPAARRALQSMQMFSVTCQPRQVLWKLPFLIFKSKPGKTADKFSQVCTTLAIQAQPGYNYSLDGELFSCDGDTVTINPGPDIEFIIF